MPTIADYLKYANLQMAAEALYGFDANVDSTLAPGSRRENWALNTQDNLTTGNRHASKFTAISVQNSGPTALWQSTAPV